MPTIDLSDVKGLDPIPAGKYVATITEAKTAVSKAGNEMIQMRWHIEEGEYEGRIVFDNMVFSSNAMWRVKQTLIGLGFPKDYTGNVEPDDLIGLSANIVVTIEQSNQLDEEGEPYPPRNQVKRVMSLSTEASVEERRKDLFSR